MTIVVTPIPRLTAFAAPALTLGTANAAGTAETTISTDSTILAFDTTLPDAIAFGQSGAVGSATVASHRDHSHAMASQTRAQVAVGSYTGDGTTDLEVTGVGFQPSAIWLAFKQTVNQGQSNIVYCTPQILDDVGGTSGIFHKGAGGHATYTGLVVSFDADGFSVTDGGGDGDPNTNGAVYNYLAIG